MKKFYRKVEDFFLTPSSPLPLGVLRVGLGVVLLLQAYYLRHWTLDYFSSLGIIQANLAKYLSSPFSPRMSFFVDFFHRFGIAENTTIYGMCSLYVASLFLFTFGLWTRSASILAWFLHWLLTNTGYTTSYGVDLYVHFSLFYLMFSPCGEALSLDVLLGRRSSAPSMSATLVLRVIQLHLCISYFCSGVEKAMGPQWWNGELMWEALNLPVYKVYDMTWLLNWPFLSKIAGWSTLALELGYFIFIWLKPTRVIWIVAMFLLHVGIGVFLGLGIFGAVMAILTPAVFGVPLLLEYTSRLKGEVQCAPAT